MNKKKNSLDILKLILIGLLGLFSPKKNSKSVFPEKLGKFEFRKIITNKARGTKLGIYEYKKQKAIVKTYQGKFKSMDYFILKNEIAVTNLLSAKLKQIGRKIPNDIKDIKIPKTLFIEESNDRLYLVSEFINSVSLKSRPLRNQIEIYLKVVRFLKYLGENMTAKEKTSFSQRKSSTLIKLYPLLLIKSMITHPSASLKLIKGIPVFFRFFVLLYQLKIVLSHRDLHLENILVSKKDIYLIDLEYMVFAPEIFDEITTLRYEWNSPKTRAKLLENIKSNYKSYHSLPNVVRIIALNIATHSLTANNFPSYLKKNYINLLDYALKPAVF